MLAAHPDPARFLRFDAKHRTALVTLIAGYDSSNNGFNFDGYGRGELLVSVPLGWRVRVTCTNRAPLPNSCAIVRGAGTATPDFGVRRYAVMQYESTYPAKVDLRGKRACAEDSGGPVFVVENARRIPRYVDTLAGTLQDDFSSSQSGLADVFNRLDTPKPQRFLRKFLRVDSYRRDDFSAAGSRPPIQRTPSTR